MFELITIERDIFFLNFGQKLSEIFFYTKQYNGIKCGLGHAFLPKIVKIGQNDKFMVILKFNDPKI